MPSSFSFLYKEFILGIYLISLLAFNIKYSIALVAIFLSIFQEFNTFFKNELSQIFYDFVLSKFVMSLQGVEKCLVLVLLVSIGSDLKMHLACQELWFTLHQSQ